MSKKRILVLGGSYLQSDFVETALLEGHEVHVLDRNPKAYLNGNEMVKFEAIDISNFESVNAYFETERCDIVLSPITEIGNKVASQVAAKHNLPYNSIETVIATTDKRVMRDRLEGKFSTDPKVYSLDEERKIPQSLNFPFILKPSISSASRGVTLINSQADFENALERALPYCLDVSEILLEEFIEGTQYSIETISFAGKHFVVGIVKEVLSGAPYFMERMDVVDKDNTKELLPIVEPFIVDLLNELNIEYGPCHTEVKIKDEQIALIEIASRSGLVRDRLLKVAGGVNYNKLILQSYLGISEPDLAMISLPTTNAMLGIMAYEEDIEAFKLAKEDGLVKDEYFYYKLASVKATMLTDAIGYYFLESDDVKVFDKYAVKL